MALSHIVDRRVCWRNKRTWEKGGTWFLVIFFFSYFVKTSAQEDCQPLGSSLQALYTIKITSRLMRILAGAQGWREGDSWPWPLPHLSPIALGCRTRKSITSNQPGYKLGLSSTRPRLAFKHQLSEDIADHWEKSVLWVAWGISFLAKPTWGDCHPHTREQTPSSPLWLAIGKSPHLHGWHFLAPSPWDVCRGLFTLWVATSLLYGLNMSSFYL